LGAGQNQITAKVENNNAGAALLTIYQKTAIKMLGAHLL